MAGGSFPFGFRVLRCLVLHVASSDISVINNKFSVEKVGLQCQAIEFVYGLVIWLRC